MIPSPRLKTGQSSTSQTVPAPIGGLNGRDPLASMARTDAYYMDNIIPGTASVDSRKGCEKFSTAGLGGPVQSLEVYTGATADVLLAFAAGKIFDVSNGIASQLTTGRLSNVVITAMFSNAATDAQFMIIVDGVDTPASYNATAGLANLVITGMVGSSTTLNFVFAYKERLYFAQNNMLGFYYLPVGQIQGALAYFDLAQVSKLGGNVVAIASFSDSGNGETPRDYIVFITSKGECIVYAGYDPSSAATWELVGRYFTAEPIGKKCTINYASELVILTLEGAISFSKIRATGSDRAQTSGGGDNAITSKLGSFLSAFNINKTVPGWQGVQYTSQENVGWLILNVPATSSLSGAYYHYVMNTVTKAWCRFTDWNGMCFAVFNSRLYFGRYDGYVMLADEGRVDDLSPIKVDVKSAYDYFEDGSGLGMLQKHFQWASLLISCDGSPPLSGRYNVDYTEDQPDYINQLNPATGAEWDVAFWDLAEWGDDARTQRFIITLNKGGTAGALWLRASLDGLTFKWFATQYVMEKTRGLLI